MNFELITATRDGHNFAILLNSLKSGKSTFEITFMAMEDHYKPFLNADFKRAFYRGVMND